MKVEVIRINDTEWYNHNQLGKRFDVKPDQYGSFGENYYEIIDGFHKGKFLLVNDCMNVDEYLVEEKPLLCEQVKSREFESGAKRDADNEKPAIHNLKGYTRLRFGYHMRLGANKYGDANWEKGIPTKSYMDSLDRHVALLIDGCKKEDHLSAIIFNVQGIMMNEKNEGVEVDYFFKLLNKNK